MSTPAAVEQKAIALPEQARATPRIENQLTYDRVAFQLRDVVTVRNEIRAYHAPLKQKAHEAHQAICDAETRMLQPVAEAERIYKFLIAQYEREQLAVQEEMRRRAKEEAERTAAAERARQLEEAAEEANRQVTQLAAEAITPEELRVIEEQRESIVESALEQARAEPSPPVRYEVEPAIYKARGISSVISYEVEIVSIRDLARAVADGQVPTEYVSANLSALNRVAKALKKSFSVPGTRLIETSGVRARGR